MQNNDERLAYEIEAIQHKFNVLQEEYKKIKAYILQIKGTGKDTTYLVQQLRDNLASQEEIYNEIRQAYKDALKIR